MKSLNLRSELLVMDGLSRVQDMGDYWVQETPSEPNYWMGNQIILKRADFPADKAMAAFEASFPSKTHRAFLWDIPNLNRDVVAKGFEALGCEIDCNDTLVLSGEIADAETPSGITLRMLETDSDWDAAHALQLEVAVEEGYPVDTHAPYLARRNKGRRAQIARGLGAWFGAYDGDQLVAHMGMFHNDEIARYQSVETKATHRRRGICTALLRHCCLWAQERAPAAQVVIVAEAKSDAGRLYRRMGFRHVATDIGAIRPGC